MEVKSEKKLKLNQDPSTIWKVMINPSIMVVSVPGAELTEQLDDRNFRGKILIKIGPVTAKFNGEASFTKLEESTFKLTLVGKGMDTGGKGGAKMSMDIHLSPEEDGTTEMFIIMTLSITGKLAQFGSRMLVAVNNKMFDQWARNFIALMENHANVDSFTEENNVSDTEALSGSNLAWTAVKGLFGENEKKIDTTD